MHRYIKILNPPNEIVLLGKWPYASSIWQEKEKGKKGGQIGGILVMIKMLTHDLISKARLSARALHYLLN